MGVDLKLLPLDADHPAMRFSHTVLECGGGWGPRWQLWDAITALEPKSLGSEPPFNCYLAIGQDGEPTYGEVTEDGYGAPLTYLPAAVFHRLQRAARDCYRLRAALAYIAELPPDTKIVLYWH